MPIPRVILPLLSALALAGCVVAPYPPRPVAVYADTGEPVASTEVPPPAAYAEVVPVMPFAGAIWLGGYWGWHGGRHHWVHGHWAQPRVGFFWSPYRWAPYQGRWHLRGGGWVRH
jgi:hypothetical protein